MQKFEHASFEIKDYVESEHYGKFVIEPLERVINDLKQADTHSKDLIIAYSDTDTTDIETDCNFKPTISFVEGISLTMEWLKSLN